MNFRCVLGLAVFVFVGCGGSGDDGANVPSNSNSTAAASDDGGTTDFSGTWLVKTSLAEDTCKATTPDDTGISGALVINDSGDSIEAYLSGASCSDAFSGKEVGSS